MTAPLLTDIIYLPLILCDVIKLASTWDEKAAHLGGFFTFQSKRSMEPIRELSKKTAIYVDGYNLYYGRLRGTEFKWLDIAKLCRNILVQRDQNENLERINVFTAHALARFATNGQRSVEAQSLYHRALKFMYGDILEIIYGKHAFDKNGTLLPEFLPDQSYDRSKRIRVWKLEEKQTDVNLAISMYRDAAKGLNDRIILMSNDSDAAPALKAIREDFSHIMIGVVIPVHPSGSSWPPHRCISGSLSEEADWIIKHLTDEQLSNAQLPSRVPTNKKMIVKPSHW